MLAMVVQFGQAVSPVLSSAGWRYDYFQAVSLNRRGQPGPGPCKVCNENRGAYSML
jgi:hypothetical protein